MEAGEHADAIRILEETLAKYPDSAAWTQSLLGVEYVRMDRYDDAVTSFDQAVQLLPHDAVNRYNLGLALVLAVHYDRAEEELRTALKLNHSNANAKKLLDALIDRRIAQSRE
jgi:tetratricopeptide (TPR) repeat protein